MDDFFTIFIIANRFPIFRAIICVYIYIYISVRCVWRISSMLNRKNINCPTLETHAHIGWAGGSASDLGSLTEQRGRDKS